MISKLSSPLLINSIRYSILPLLTAIYPAVFHYANNARLVRFSSFLELCIFLIGISLAVYLILELLTRGKYAQSALGASGMLALFHLYGIGFDAMHSLDILQIETYNFLPFWIFISLNVVWHIFRLESKRASQVWRVSFLIFAMLILINMLEVILTQLDKDLVSETRHMAIDSSSSATDNHYPDIYYLLFDEAAGFEVVRRYWNYSEVNDFVGFLESSGFYVAEFSHSGSTHTLREIATRLNYEQIAVGDEYFTLYDDMISSNRVMSFLKEYGYTLVAFDERRTAYPTSKALPVDVLMEESPDQAGASNVSIMDEYKLLVLRSTLLRPFISVEPETRSHLNLILHTTDSVSSDDVSSPKMVYVHLMLPHVPFAFTETGGVVPIQTEYFNWQRYLDNYKFSIRVMREMVGNIFASSEPERPPVIIIQSDHGARNQDIRPYSGNLEDYPEEYKTWIINAMLLPGCEDAPFHQDLDPINTFPIVFNCYFDANIGLK